MGTNIFLRKKGSESDEEEAYIRASIWAKEENGALRRIFPEEFWDGNFHEFDFSANADLVKNVLASYVTGVVSVEFENKEVNEFVNKLGTALERTFPRATIVSGGELDKQEWAKSVLKFFGTGFELQKNGECPEVLISW